MLTIIAMHDLVMPPAQEKRVAYMVARDWQHIADCEDGSVLLTIPTGCRYLDAIVAPNGHVSYSSPRI